MGAILWAASGAERRCYSNHMTTHVVNGMCEAEDLSEATIASFKHMLWPFIALPTTYVVLDTETSGLPDDEGLPGIASIGVALVDNGNVVESEEFLVRPHRQMHPEAVAINGITDEAAQAHPEFAEQWDRIRPWLDGNLIVIHNAVFDWTLLTDHVERYGVQAPAVNGVFCSQRLSQPWASAAGLRCSERGPSLNTLTKAMGVIDYREALDGLHGAVRDASQTALVVEALRRHAQG